MIKPSGSSWLNNVEGYGTKFGGVFDWQEVALLLKKSLTQMREEKNYLLIKMRGKGKGRYGWYCICSARDWE